MGRIGVTAFGRVGVSVYERRAGTNAGRTYTT